MLRGCDLALVTAFIFVQFCPYYSQKHQCIEGVFKRVYHIYIRFCQMLTCTSLKRSIWISENIDSILNIYISKRLCFVIVAFPGQLARKGHNHEAHPSRGSERRWNEQLTINKITNNEKIITKTSLFKYTVNFTTKKWKFSDKILLLFIFLLKI